MLEYTTGCIISSSLQTSTVCMRSHGWNSMRPAGATASDQQPLFFFVFFFFYKPLLSMA